jgi:RNA polymerase sigma-70 factor, ECF subfamily
MSSRTLTEHRSSTPADGSLDAAATVFAAQRRRLFGIAYRVVGSWTDAEDVVQDVWLRWQGCDRSRVRYPSAFLATTTVRMAINASQSARVRRETSVGDWPSEPVDTTGTPGSTADRERALERAILLVLAQLTPTERAAYLLREAFAYPYARIASVLQVTEVNARQIVSRAGRHVARGRAGSVSPAAHRRLLQAFVGAAERGDVDGLEALLVSGLHATGCRRGPAHHAAVADATA